MTHDQNATSLPSSHFSDLPISAQLTNASLLWRITGKQMTKPSYLFGTMHLICRSDYVWTPAMGASLDKSEKVCFEMDLDDNNVMVEATSGLIDSTGKKLSDYFHR
jgi:uncharacterized protein YbaP (TraB family)